MYPSFCQRANRSLSRSSTFFSRSSVRRGDRLIDSLSFWRHPANAVEPLLENIVRVAAPSPLSPRAEGRMVARAGRRGARQWNTSCSCLPGPRASHRRLCLFSRPPSESCSRPGRSRCHSLCVCRCALEWRPSSSFLLIPNSAPTAPRGRSPGFSPLCNTDKRRPGFLVRHARYPRQLSVVRLVPGILLGSPNPCLNLRPAAHQVNSAPGEESGYGIEIASKRLESKPCGLKRHGASTAKAVANPSPVPKGFLRELEEEIVEVMRICAEVAVDLLPCVRSGPVDFLRPAAFRQLFFIWETRESCPLQPFLVFSRNTSLPTRIPVVTLDESGGFFRVKESCNILGR